MPAGPVAAPAPAHRDLRAATRPEHARIDELMSNCDLTQSTGYGRFLTIHAIALERLAPAWLASDAEDFERLRACLAADLAALDPAAQPRGVRPSAPQPQPQGESAECWGVGYVIRGSRLGGKVLRRRMSPRFAASYLDCEPLLRWPDFLAQLDRRAGTPGALESMIVGARTAFAAFAAAALASGRPADE